MTASIVIPVFNVADYLPAALDSLLAQTSPDWEALCVDDGSTDRSPDILEAYARRDPRIRVTRLKTNRGVSTARNTALTQARNEAILFLDPDDTVESQWLSQMTLPLESSDCVLAGYAIDGHPVTPADVGAVYTGGAVRQRMWQAFFGYQLRDLVNLVLPGGLWKRSGREMAGVWRCAIRRETLGDLRFDENLRLYEDAMFLSRLALRATSLSIISSAGYDWAVRPTGAMKRQAHERFLENKMAVRDIRLEIDPSMSHWRGTFLLSTLEILKRIRSPKAAWSYARLAPR